MYKYKLNLSKVLLDSFLLYKKLSFKINTNNYKYHVIKIKLCKVKKMIIKNNLELFELLNHIH